MSRWLLFDRHDTEGYELDDDSLWTLEEAIEEEARKLAEDAGSDEIDDPSPEARERYKADIVAEATARLLEVGDTYKDPMSVTWRLVERGQGGLY
jgi:hypothetical protein